MAAREGQGLQIAVIMFAMLTIILAITTYVFYAQAESAQAEADKFRTENANVTQGSNRFLYQSLAMQYVLGEGGVTKDQVDNARTSAGGADEVADRVLKNFNDDMLLYGDQVAAEGPRNYRTLPAYLLTAINNKNNSIVTEKTLSTDYQREKEATKAAEAQRVATAEAAQKSAQDDLSKEREAFNAERGRVSTEKDKIASQLAEKDAIHKKEVADLNNKLQQVVTLEATTRATMTAVKNKLDEQKVDENDLFENPDGKITGVNQRQGLVWINLGSASGLQRQTSFSVYPHDINGVSSAKPKARIEVVRIIDSNMAECRILEDKSSDPILPDDIIYTPVWSPGQKIHFVLAGFMDIDGDGVSDREMIRNIIQINGGIIDAELKDNGERVGTVTANTRYLVLGEKPTEKTGAQILKEYNFLLNESTQRYGTDVISLQKLLDRLGWKSEERTVELGSAKTSTDFTPRKPGEKAPGAAPAAPAAPPAGGEVDPFGAPAAPAPAPMPAEVDPFG